MHLNVPKQYRSNARRRRRLFRWRWIVLWLVTLGLVYLGYDLLRNPVDARQSLENALNNAENSFNEMRSDMFPEEPTPTPDVTNDLAQAETAYRAGNLEEALAFYRRAIQGQPNNTALHTRYAHTLIITSNFGQDTPRLDEALKVSELAINAAPESPEGWAVRAMALDWSGKSAQGLASAQRALELDPNNVLARAHLANIYRNLGNVDLAQGAINQSIEQLNRQGGSNDAIAQVYRNYGRLLNQLAEYEDAAEALERAYQAMPIHTYIAIDLADTYTALGENARAIALLEEVRTTNGRDVVVLSALGERYLFNGEAARAIELYTTCVNVNPDYVPCLSNLGRLQYRVNQRYDLARDYLTDATQLGSTHPYDWYLLGRSYFQLQQCGQAGQYLNRGYELLATNPVAEVTESDFITAFRACNLPEPAGVFNTGSQ